VAVAETDLGFKDKPLLAISSIISSIKASKL